jgi:hypothetical protein
MLQGCHYHFRHHFRQAWRIRALLVRQRISRLPRITQMWVEREGAKDGMDPSLSATGSRLSNAGQVLGRRIKLFSLSSSRGRRTVSSRLRTETSMATFSQLTHVLQVSGKFRCSALQGGGSPDDIVADRTRERIASWPEISVTDSHRSTTIRRSAVGYCSYAREL